MSVGAALGAAGIVVAAVALEIFIRMSGYHRAFAEPDAFIGYVLTPHFSRVVPILEHAGASVLFRTNNLGLRRDDDTSIVKPAGTARVLVLGDSQTEGMVSNDESYSAGLERALNATESEAAKREAHRVEVLNAAVSGYSPLLEYLWLRERGSALRPDVILVALYAGNDIGELLMHQEDFGGFGPRFTLPFLEQRDGEWQIKLPSNEGGALGRLDWLLQTHVRLYAMVRRTITPKESPKESPKDAVLKRVVVERSPGCLQTLWQAFIAHADLSALAGGFARLDYILEQFQIEARRLDARLLVVVIPSKLETEGAERTAGVRGAMETLGLDYDANAFDSAVRERMIALAEQHGIATVDLLPVLRSWFLEHQRPLFWELDWHLNVDGHRVVAQHLLPIVSRFIAAEPGTPIN